MTSHIRVEAEVLTITFKTIYEVAIFHHHPNMNTAFHHSTFLLLYWLPKDMDASASWTYCYLRIHFSQNSLGPLLHFPSNVISSEEPSLANLYEWVPPPSTLCNLYHGLLFFIAPSSFPDLLYFFVCVYLFLSTNIWTPWEQRMNFFCSLLYPQCREQCLARNKYALMIHWTNESLNKYPFA